MKRKTLVLGIGNPWRGDDAVGLLIARALRTYSLPGVAVRETSTVDPSLILLWKRFDRLILLDAVVSGAAPGVLHEVDLSRQPLSPSLACGSTHSFKLGAVIELARTLQQLPPQVWFFGVEAENFSCGSPMSKAVKCGLTTCVERIVVLCECQTDLEACNMPCTMHSGL